jgi:glycosyltransferase involved in cell wall biosynthesis
MTIHLVYVKGNNISTPNAITNELEARLRERYPVIVYNYDESGTIDPEIGDVLIGHPHPFKNTVFRNSVKNGKWGKRIMMIPYHHGIKKYNSVMDDLYPDIDVFLAICGHYWYSRMQKNLYSHWYPIARQLDLAVNREYFRFFKTRFNEAGQRKFIYIGSTWDYKGTDFLAKITLCRKNVEFAWAGSGSIKKNNLRYLGVLNFSKAEDLNLIRDYDFLITTGRSDANPTTILECAAWGMIPVCTPESGYDNEDWIINIPLDDVTRACEIIDRLNQMPEEALLKMQGSAQKRIKEYYNWDRFSQVVMDAIEEPVPVKPPLSSGQRFFRCIITIRSYLFKLSLSRGKISLFKILMNKIQRQ